MAEAEDFATMIVLNKLMNREDEKPKKKKRKIYEGTTVLENRNGIIR